MTYKEALERIAKYDLQANDKFPGNGLFAASLFQQIARGVLAMNDYCKRPTDPIEHWETGVTDTITEPINDD